MYNINSLFDLSHTLARKAFLELGHPHLVVSEIKDIIRELAPSLSPKDYIRRGECIYISRRASVAQDAEIGENVIIGHGTCVRKGAYIRENALIGEACVIGNSTEIKNAIIFDECQIPHFNYVGDSILGYKAHFGAGVIASNLRSDKESIQLYVPSRNETGDNSTMNIIDTGLRKLGAIVGDFVEVGCNSVLCPGAIIERGAMIYPLSLVRGYVQGGSVFKGK